MNYVFFLLLTWSIVHSIVSTGAGYTGTDYFDSDYLLLSGLNAKKNDHNEANFFGTSIVMVKGTTSRDSWVFIGAPKSSDESIRKFGTVRGESVQNPGAVWRCKLNSTSHYKCEKMQHTQQYCNQRLGLKQRQFIDCTMANIGSTLAYGQDNLYLCAPNQRVFIEDKNKLYMRGGCYGVDKGTAISEVENVNEVCNIPEHSSPSTGAPCRLMLAAVDFTEGVQFTKMDVIAGFSAHVPTATTHNAYSFLMGVPYWYGASGGATLFPSSRMYKSEEQKELMINGQRKIPGAGKYSAESQYFGYAVTSGKYFRGDKMYAALTSTSNNRLDAWGDYIYDFKQGTAGAEATVYVVDFDKFTALKDKQPASDAWFKNKEYAMAIREADYSEFGSFFGYSLASIDLDGDEVDELLIGSPWYSNEGEFDIGLVSVLFFDNLGKANPKQVVSLRLRPDIASGNRNNRFGMSITGVGDINQDGIQDIAIAAPYEEDIGAVYFFCGSSTRRILRCGKIKPEENSQPPFAGFGYSLYGEDFDHNGSPDIGIGWLGRESVAIFRTRPTLVLSKLELKREPKHVYENFTEFRITVSLKAHLKIQTKRVRRQNTVKVDYTKGDLVVQLPLKFYFKVEPRRDYELISVSASSDGRSIGPANEMEVERMTSKNVASATVKVRRKAEDQSDISFAPVRVSYSVSYVGVENKCITEIEIEGDGAPTRKNCTTGNAATYDFCPYCPHPHKEILRTTTVDYCAICNENDSDDAKCGDRILPPCKPNVTITKASTPEQGDVLLNSVNDKLLLSFTIANSGDKLKSAAVKASFRFSDNRDVSMFVESEVYSDHNRIISSTSEFLRPFSNLTDTTLNTQPQVIKFTMPLKTFRVYSLNPISTTFKFEVLLNGVALKSVSLAYNFKPVITGATLSANTDGEQVLKSGTVWSQESLNHEGLKFHVKITAESLINGNLKILIPAGDCDSNFERSSFILHPRPQTGKGTVVCHSLKADPSTEEKLLSQLKSYISPEQFAELKDCNQAGKNYLYFVCDIMNNTAVPDFNVDFRFNLSSTDARTIINSKAGENTTIFAVGWLSLLGHESDSYSRIAVAKYTFRISDEFKMDIWVVPVAVLVGAMCLGLLIVILWKCGFFKRKAKKELAELKRQLEDAQVVQDRTGSSVRDEDNIEQSHGHIPL